ncbi:MAG: VOC family protein [Actinobacteria bacterium]|nr:VOC family protein [Actinomycetota bacterium]
MLDDARILAIVPVSDLHKARVFYEKMMGLQVKEAHEAEEDVTYSVNDTDLLVYKTDAPKGGATKVGFVVGDLAKEMDILKNHGVVFEEFDLTGLKTVNGVAEDARGKAAWFKDLDGNYLSLFESK